MSRFVYIVCWGEHGGLVEFFCVSYDTMGVDDYY